MFFWDVQHNRFSISAPINIFREIGVPIKSNNVISHEMFAYIDEVTCKKLYSINNKYEERIFRIYSHFTDPILKITRIDFSKDMNDLYEIEYYKEIHEPLNLMPGLCVLGRFQYQVALNSKELSYETKKPKEFNFMAEGWWDKNDDVYTYYGVMSNEVKMMRPLKYFLYKRKDVHDQTVPWNRAMFTNYELAINDLSLTRTLLQ